MNWKGKRILITGAGGFIGSHLAEEMVKQGAKIRAFVHYNSRGDWGNIECLEEKIKRELEIFAGNIEDPFFVREAVKGCDIVFQLAALIPIPYSYTAPASFVKTNVGGTLNVMQAALDEGIEKVIHTSTSETYGTARYTPIDENHPLQAQSPYAASKIGADKIAESYYLSFDLPVSIIRPFNTYGPRQSARAIIPTIISQALSGDEIKLGSQEPIRDFTYVKDIVEGFIRIAESEKSIGELINIGFGKGISIGELIQEIVKILGKDKTVTQDPQRVRPSKSEVMKLICNNTKAKQIIGWQPKYSLKQGLSETIGFIRKNLDSYKTNIYNI